MLKSHLLLSTFQSITEYTLDISKHARCITEFFAIFQFHKVLKFWNGGDCILDTYCWLYVLLFVVTVIAEQDVLFHLTVCNDVSCNFIVVKTFQSNSIIFLSWTY